MGVPSFYKWMVNKYPNIVVNAIEENGENIDTSSRNPNGMEFDNLYLDMNCIIHPCFHPDDHPSPPTTFDEVFSSIYEYVDRLFSIVRPRQLLYMAIDGVAPRAKMNQQRSRRFRTAKDNEIAETEEERLIKQFELEGKQVLPRVECEVSDSNIITPGTVFMHNLSEKLKIYIQSRIKHDAGWKSIKVILSDANVPGEGEHKIMSFIRQQRTLPDYNPNTRHCLYGLDADLIMLALATHEVHFSILREDVLTREQQPSVIESRFWTRESSSVKSRGWFKDPKTVNNNLCLIKKPYQFLHVWILREYLELDMNISHLPENFKIDLERIIDDFIFMCFFAGNDFLPHMPTLEIHEGAIDLLMTVYKNQFKNLGGYLVDMQRVGDCKAYYVKLKRVEKFMLLIGTNEEKIFKKRSELRERYLKRLLYSDPQQEEENEGSNLELSSKNNAGEFHNGKAPISKYLPIVPVENISCSSASDNLAADNPQILKNTKELKEKLKDRLRNKSDLFKNGAFGTDKVRLGTAGWKERYYKEKFSADSPGAIESRKKEIVQKYTEGLLWVLLYYFSGVPSWTWFYPFHYGPFASDLKGLSHVRVKFHKGSPLKPFDQLMSVLPPRSAQALPKAYQALMTDKQSRIIDFYPTDFEIDTDGKRFMWQGICKLSFIEEDHLIAETRKQENDLMEAEAVRNADKVDQLFVGRSSKLGIQILSLNPKLKSARQNEMTNIDSSLSGGTGGIMCHGDETFWNVYSTLPQKDQEDIQKYDVFCVPFDLSNGSPHIPRPLEGVLFPDKIISESDIVETPLWHDYQGSRLITRSQMQERLRKGINNEKFSSNSSPELINKGIVGKFASNTPEVIYKSAGTGWGASRGQANTGPVSVAHIPRRDSERVIVPGSSLAGVTGANSRWDVKVTSHPVTSTNHNFKLGTYGISASNEKWREVGSSRDEAEGIENLKISESGQSVRSYGNVQSVNNSFWPSRNGSTNNRNYARPQSLQYSASPSGQPWQRQWGSTSMTSSPWQHRTHFAANSSTQAYGRGHFVPATSVPTQTHGRGHFLPATSVLTQSRGGGHFVPATSVPTQARGGGHFVPATSVPTQTPGRGHFVPGTSVPTQARGGGHFVPATSVPTQARGGGHFVPATSVPTQTLGRGHFLPATSVPTQARGGGHFVPATSVPTQARGRGHFVPATSVESRGHFVPATSVPKWNSKDSTTHTLDEGSPSR